MLLFSRRKHETPTAEIAVGMSVREIRELLGKSTVRMSGADAPALGHLMPVEFRSGVRIELLKRGCPSSYRSDKVKERIEQRRRGLQTAINHNTTGEVLYLPVVQTFFGGRLELSNAYLIMEKLRESEAESRE